MMSNKIVEAYYSFVVLHFGAVEVTNRCIRSIAQLDKADKAAIVLVDNEVSKPLSDRVKAEEFESAPMSMYLLHVEGKGGFSSANNLGYAFAREKLHSKIIAMCNNDIELRSSKFLDQIDLAASEGVDVLGPAIIHALDQMRQSPLDQGDRKRRAVSKTVFLNKHGRRLLRLLYPLIYLKDNHDRCVQSRKWRAQSNTNTPIIDEPKENVVLMGACIIFMSEFVAKERKAFSPSTQFYYEEYILYHRCMLKGYKMLYCPDLSVLHESGKSTHASFGSGLRKKEFEMEQIASSAEIYRNYLDGKIKD